jgi:long-chain acyl-CoA synthetase
MDVDFELYRQDVIVSRDPLIRLSVIDIAPERPLNTLVMVHGFGGNACQWQYQLRTFTDTHRCIAIDLRGHGHSDKPATEYTVDEMIDDLNGVLSALNVEEPFILIGHSFGGGIVTSFAHRYPDRVERLILTATAGKFDLPFYTRIVFSIPTPILNIARPFIRTQISSPPFVLKRFFHHAMDPWVGWDLMRELQMPVLVIRADRDIVFPQAAYEEVTRVIPNAEEINVGASAHMVILERRDAVNRAIDRFLGTGHASWRSGAQETEARARLLEERPWLKVFEEGVPFTIGLPERPLHTILTSAARRFARHPATIFMNRALTYRDIERQSNRLANALRGMGVDTGTRVMLLMPNCPQWVIAFYGILKAGAVVVSASPVAPVEEIIREVKDSRVQILITLTKLSDLARTVADQTDLGHIIFTNIKDYLHWWQKAIFTLGRESKEGHRLSRPLREGERTWIDLMKGYRPQPVEVNISPQDTALIQYTGGTTANPKGVILSHRALVANAFQTRHWIPGLSEGQERVLCVVPFAHVYGMTAAMNVGIALGGTLIILPNFVTADVLQAIKRHKPTLFPGVPTMYVAINNFPGVRRFGIRGIKACISGAAPLPVEVQETFEKLTKGRLVEGYGLTEAAPVTHANPLHGARKVGTIGVPLPNTEARIVDLQTGAPVSPGQIGELIVRGPQIMDGYWNLDETDGQSLHDGWLYTGDVARMDSDGYFQIISRKKDMWYPARGQQEPYPAFPRDVEEVIYEIPEVKEAAVVGIKNIPVAFVTPRRTIEPGTIITYCSHRLPDELVPKLVVFVDEMPKSFVGKIIRRHLLDHIPERQRKELDIISDRIDEMLDYPFNDKTQ